MQNQKQPNYLVLILIAVIAFLVIRGMGDGKDGGGDDLDIVARQSKVSMVEYVTSVGDDHIAIGREIKAGKITNAVQLKEAIQARTLKSKNSAFADIDVLDNRNVPAEFKDKLDEVGDYMITKGENYKSVVK